MVPYRDIRVVRHENPSPPALRSELALAAPAAALQGLVRSYQGSTERSDVPVRRREVPTGRGVVILDLGDGWDVVAAGAPDEDVVRRRSFAEEVGLAPKAVARVLRFRRAAELLADPAGPPPAAVAARCA